MEEVMTEIGKRVKRLEGELELLEKQLERNGDLKPPDVGALSVYYLAFMAIWIITGIILLAYVRSRFSGVGVPVGLYTLISLATVGPPLAYILWRRTPPEDPLRERLTAVRLTLTEFYRPLEKALKENDRDALLALADRLLEDTRLASAVELANEGNAKLNAYALYLYARYSRELKEEVEETVKELTNKPLRLLLLSLLKE